MSVRILLKGWDTPRRTLRYVALLGATHLLASVILFAYEMARLGESLESIAMAAAVEPIWFTNLVFGIHHSTSMAGDWLATVNLSYLVAAALLVGGMRLRTRSSEVEVEDETPV